MYLNRVDIACNVEPYEIIKMSAKSCKVRKMDSVLVEHNSINQKWNIRPNSNNEIITVHLAKCGQWMYKGDYFKLDEVPEKYYNFAY